MPPRTCAAVTGSDRRTACERRTTKRVSAINAGEERSADFRPEFAQRLHRDAAVALEEEREHRQAVFLGQLGEELREVGRVLLLEEIDEVGRGPHAQEALDRVEHDVELALGHSNSPI